MVAIDKRTEKKLGLKVFKEGIIKVIDLRRKEPETRQGLKPYDLAYFNTTPNCSSIHRIDRDKGILWYRAYPLFEEIAKRSTFIEDFLKT